MVSSLGETDIQCGSRIIGKLRALHLFADSAIYPRLGIRLGCSLYEVQEAQVGHTPPLTGYELIGMSGELRLAEHGHVVGPVLAPGRSSRVRSSAFPHEHQLTLTCDLDHLRLERIEEWRGGQPPRFWLHLWPSLVRAGQYLDSDARAFALHVPREYWLEFLGQSRSTGYSVIEVRFPPSEAAVFQAALGHLRAARASIDAGDLRAAVGNCRLALDAVLDEHPRVPRGPRQEQIKALWELAEERAHSGSVDQYRSIFSKLNGLTSVTHHNYGAAVAFRRSEALFVVQTMESMLALLGDLTTRA